MAERTVQKLQTEIDRMEVKPAVFLQKSQTNWFWTVFFLCVDGHRSFQKEWQAFHFLSFFSNLKYFFPCRPHCWLRRRRRPVWRRTWSTLFRASATSKKFWRVPPAFEAWGDTLKSRSSQVYVWKEEERRCESMKAFLKKHLDGCHACRSVQSQCPVNN